MFPLRFVAHTRRSDHSTPRHAKLTTRPSAPSARPIVLFGSNASVNRTSVELARHPDPRFRVVGAVVATAVHDSPVAGERKGARLGDERLFAELETTMRRFGADTVMVTSTDHLSPVRVQRLSDRLEAGSLRVVIAPELDLVMEHPLRRVG